MNMFRRERPPTQPPVPPRPTPQELENPVTHSLNKQDSENTHTQRTGVMSVMHRVNPFRSSPAQDAASVVASSSSDSLDEAGVAFQNPGVFRGAKNKINPFKSKSVSDAEAAGREDVTPALRQGPGLMSGLMSRVSPFRSSQAPKTESAEPPDPAPQAPDPAPQTKQNPGVISGMIHKVNPFKSKEPKLHRDVSNSDGSLTDNNNVQDKQIFPDENPTPEPPPRPQQISIKKQNPELPPRPNQQGVFRGMMQKVNPFKSSQQVGDCEPDGRPKRQSDTETVPGLESSSSSSSESLNDETIQRHSIWYTDTVGTEVQSKPKEPKKKRTKTFRLKKILPTGLFGSGTQNADAAEAPAQTEETVQIQPLEFADVSSDGAGLDPLDDEDGLLSWWNTVEGWHEWNESNQDAEAEDVVEEAADRVFMAARLFVRLFNKRGGSLQQKILELLAMADAADSFHKKTVTASVGGGVASVAGSITTITGLILAPFTAGTSLIVTAVGIGVATAGGLTSASANITDTVHSKTDRKKVEKMIQDYQDEIKDIKDCLDFLQEGMETLEEWNFEQYAEAIAKKHLNQNVKHVVKEGGRAGKALVINTESLINTVQVLSVAGGAAKAAQVMSVTTGVMSGLFLALDVFFLAKDSIELKQGAKTDFAAKIREVCKDLQNGLLELNRIKEDLQKTMDGIEVEVEEEEDEEVLKSDLKKLIELEE
ncbi:uncharacterized protein apold1b isoform X4 [Periophthalmus magnuspinnatus]|uniref:uncharacterized protein apold1b isoform X4 n=1 Tax=Periophthalmus magnuspinnatus TaxID=409849 RepID=UPI0024365861|nr:uncharacterized protein apold1b isoform X4 [Periophthalmus magnuspinnatus]